MKLTAANRKLLTSFQLIKANFPMRKTYQLDDLNENPVISRRRHEFEEKRGQ